MFHSFQLERKYYQCRQICSKAVVTEYMYFPEFEILQFWGGIKSLRRHDLGVLSTLWDVLWVKNDQNKWHNAEGELAGLVRIGRKLQQGQNRYNAFIPLLPNNRRTDNLTPLGVTNTKGGN